MKPGSSRRRRYHSATTLRLKTPARSTARPRDKRGYRVRSPSGPELASSRNRGRSRKKPCRNVRTASQAATPSRRVAATANPNRTGVAAARLSEAIQFGKSAPARAASPASGSNRLGWTKTITVRTTSASQGLRQPAGRPRDARRTIHDRFPTIPPATAPPAATPLAASSPSPASTCAGPPALTSSYTDHLPCVKCVRALAY